MFSGSGGSAGGNLVQHCWGLDFPKQDELRLPWVAIWHILMHIHKGGLVMPVLTGVPGWYICEALEDF